MKNTLRSFVTKIGLITLLFFAHAAVGQAAFTSVSSGNWTDAARWTISSGTDADGIPDADDTVTIAVNHTITVNTGSQACATLSLTPNNNSTATILFNSGTALTVTGTVNVGSAGNRYGRVNMTAGGTLTCNDINLINNSFNTTFNAGSGTVIFTGTDTIPSSIFNSFNNLTVASGTTTTSSAVTVAGNLSVASGGTFATGTTNSWTLAVSGTTSVSGTLTLANTGTKSFTGNVTVNAGGTWNETNAATINFAANLQNDGTFNASTGSHAFTGGGAKSIGAATGIAIPSLSVTGTVNNNTTLTVSNTLAGGGTLINTANNTLNFGGATISPTLTATASGNVVDYNGTGNQNVKNTLYTNLVASGGGIKSFPAAITISGNLSIEFPAEIDFTNGTVSTAATLTLGGAGQNSGTWGGSGSGAANINTNYFELSTNGRINIATGTCTTGIWTGAASNNWNTAANWCGGVPTASTDVIIPPGMPNSPNIPASSNAVCRNITINSGATLNMANSASALLGVNGNFTNNGTLAAGAASTISFVGSSAQVVTGTSTTAFSNLIVNTATPGVTVTNTGRTFTASGNMTITQGNFVTEATNASYSVTGNVLVSANGTWTHNVDWDSTNAQFNISGNLAIDGVYSRGAASRSHVQMNGSGRTIRTGTSALNILTMNTIGAITADGPVTTNDNFWAMIGATGGSFSTNGQTITANASFLNAGGTVNINGGSLNVTGGVNCGMNGVAGTMVLSSGTLNADALYLGVVTPAINGNFSHTGGIANIGNLVINATPTASSYICSGSPVMNISGNWINNATFTKATSTVNFTGNTAISGSAANSFHNVGITGALTAPAATINVSGSWTNNGGTYNNSNGTVNMNGTTVQAVGGSAATTFHNLTVNNAGGMALTGDIGVNNTLTMTNGNIELGSGNLTMGATAPAISGSFSAARMIIANGSGELRKNATSNASASYTFPIGENSGTVEYSPVTLAVTASGYASAHVGVNVGDAKHPNNSSANNFLTRYWNVSQSGMTGATATVTGTYYNTASDVTGTLATMRTAQLNGAFNQVTNPWLRSATAPSGTTFTYTGATLTSGQTSAFTAISSTNPTVTVSGGGVTVCQNATVTLTAAPVGDGTFAYAWTGLISGSTTSVNATADTSAAGGPNAYSVIVRDGNGIASAASTAVNVTVVALPVAGTLTPAVAPGNICVGTAVSATLTAGSGGTGTVADELQVSLSGGTFTTYTSGASINTTGQTSVVIRTRRTATGTGCTTSGYNTVTWTMTSLSVAGSISGGGGTVCSGSNSTLLTLSGNTGTIQWQSSSDNITFNNILGETAATFTATNLSATTYYRAVVANGVCSSATTVAVVVNVSPVSVSGTISGGATVCAGTNSTLLTLSGSVGAIQWQSSLDNVAFANILGATSATYTATNLGVTTYYRAVVTSGVCSAATTFGSTQITVNPVSVAGSIGGATTVCSGANSTLLTLTGHTGNVQWQSSSDNITFNNILGATAATYTAVNLMATTYYHAVVTSGICAPAISSPVGIVVNPVSIAGTVTASQNAVCFGPNSTLLSVSGNTGAIQWQSSTNDVTFADILGATSTTYTATNLSVTTFYRVRATSGVCGAVTSASEVIDVFPVSVSGSILGAGSVCSGGDVLLRLTGNTGSIQWQSSSDNIVFTNISGANATTYNVVNVTGMTYFRVVVASGVCASATSSAVAVMVGGSTVWNGSAWSNGAPTASMTATISGSYNLSVDLLACSLTVNNNAAVVIPAGFDVNLNGSLTVVSGSFTLENNANLLQATNAVNSGNIIVKRNSSAIRRQDYTLWTSPVAGQNLLAFSPATVVTPTSRFYQYNSSTNSYNSIAAPGAQTMNTAQGYLIRVANNHPEFPWIWNGQFAGVPHNGNYSYSMFNGGNGLRFNLVGNPYPSPISATAFASANSAQITQTLYFWRETNNDTTNNAYCSWSPAGGPTGTFVTNGQAAVVNPNGIIQTGQGFFVEGTVSGTQVNFTNAMRTGNNSNQFFRPGTMASSPADSENHRVWINLTNAAGAFCQTAFGYMTDATNGYDLGIDGKYINSGDTELYSIVDAEKTVIQGRTLPFVSNDIVPLGFKAATAGTFSIAIDHVDGLFSEGQSIYLKDNQTGTQHLLNGSAYSFTTEAGEFASRFEIVYQAPLATANPTFENMVSIIKSNGVFAIDSGLTTMSNVKVFDIRGRLIIELKNVNASQATFNAGEANQVLIVKITSEDGALATKKVIN